MKIKKQGVVIKKLLYATTYENYEPVQYEIEVEDSCLTGISEDSAHYIYSQLGKLLNMEGGKV